MKYDRFVGGLEKYVGSNSSVRTAGVTRHAAVEKVPLLRGLSSGQYLTRTVDIIVEPASGSTLDVSQLNKLVDSFEQRELWIYGFFGEQVTTTVDYLDPTAQVSAAPVPKIGFASIQGIKSQEITLRDDEPIRSNQSHGARLESDALKFVGNILIYPSAELARRGSISHIHEIDGSKLPQNKPSFLERIFR